MAASTQGKARRRWPRMAAALLLLGLAGWAALRLSPWPAVLLIRQVFDRGSARAAAALEKHVPAGVDARRNLVYDSADPHARLDLYLPPPRGRGTAPLATVVWIHGGGFVSGRKEDIGNYARILAARGFAVASVDYTLAPTARWPGPTRQANTALGWLRDHAGELGLDPSRFVLAGDSAGAQIAAELANAVTSPAHARALGLAPALRADQLAGVVLYCGPYDTALIRGTGPMAGFVRTVLWAYFGERDDPRTGVFSVARHLTPAFPPAFVSAGNGDPLLPHSRALADALRRQGVRVQTLFFADDRTPALPHEYQFDLDGDAGRQALEASVAFLQSLGRTPAANARTGTAPASGQGPGAAPPAR